MSQLIFVDANSRKRCYAALCVGCNAVVNTDVWRVQGHNLSPTCHHHGFGTSTHLNWNTLVITWFKKTKLYQFKALKTKIYDKWTFLKMCKFVYRVSQKDPDDFLKMGVASKWVKPRLQNFLCFLSIIMANFSENLVAIASIFSLYMALLCHISGGHR